MATTLNDAQIADIVRRAARRLQETADVVVLTAEVIDARDVEALSSGWCELGRIDDAFGRCWWRVLYHPESAEGRMVREFPRAKRGPLGEILQKEDDRG